MVDYVDFTNGTLADETVFQNLMNAGVAHFATTGTRTTALPSPATGQLSFVAAIGILEIYTGSQWVPLPGTTVCKMSRATTSTVTSGSNINWDTEAIDPYSGHSLVTNLGRYTAPFAGQFEVVAALHHGVITSGTTLTAQLKVNGTNTGAGVAVVATASGTAGTTIPVLDTLQLSTGDYIDIGIGNSAGTAINASGSAVTIKYVGF